MLCADIYMMQNLGELRFCNYNMLMVASKNGALGQFCFCNCDVAGCKALEGISLLVLR